MKEIYGDRYDVESYLDLYRQKAEVDEMKGKKKSLLWIKIQKLEIFQA